MPYNFTHAIAIPDAFDAHLRSTLTFASLYQGMSASGDQLTIYMSVELTEEQLTELTSVVDNYVDPATYLTLNRTESYALHSHFTADPANVVVDGKFVMQTLIFKNSENTESVALDAIKTIVEYNCPDPVAFYASSAGQTVGHVNIELYDVSRNLSISNLTVDLNEIADQWNTLGAANNSAPNTKWRSLLFSGLMNLSTNYDCIWQVRGSVSDPATFDYRINGMQYLFYDVQRS